VPNFAGSADQAAASELFRTVLAERYFEQLVGWLERQREEPRAWQEAAQFGDLILYLTAEELAELGREVDALAERYLERTARGELRPGGARKVTFLRLAFPTPPLPGERGRQGAAGGDG
jgi:hypothetical protein